MKTHIGLATKCRAAALLVLLAIALPRQGTARTIEAIVYTVEDLYEILSHPADTLFITLGPGDYHLWPTTARDEGYSQLGREVVFTYGLMITGKFVSIRGSKNYTSVIYTNAGYGLLLKDCENVHISGLIISGGQRDLDSHATNAAIVVVNSKAHITDNLIFENMGDSAKIAESGGRGIMGICVRENAYAFVFNNQIVRNSWTGIGVYNNGQATISGNLIDGIKYQTAKASTTGKGMGILVTRQGMANIETNLIKRYEAGIGIFANASVNVLDNLIEDIDLWGIMIWDADTGAPEFRIEKNIIFKTGACGIGMKYFTDKRARNGNISRNVIVQSAQNTAFDPPEILCWQCPLAAEGRPTRVGVTDNLFYRNRWVHPCPSSMDTDARTFGDRLMTDYSSVPLKWYGGYSEFIQLYYVYLPVR